MGVLYRGPIKVSHTGVPYRSAIQGSHTGVPYRGPIYRGLIYRGLIYRGLLQGCHTVVTYSGTVQGSHTVVPYRGAIQGSPPCLADAVLGGAGGATRLLHGNVGKVLHLHTKSTDKYVGKNMSYSCLLCCISFMFQI
jgi:hypothetical protein